MLESTSANSQSLPQGCTPNPDRATKGQWCTIPAFTDPVVAIHTTVLPNGKVLTWGANLANGNQTQAQLWNPNSPSTPPHQYTLDASFGNIFCSGHSLMPDGKLLITGGQELYPPDGYFTGIAKTAIYDYNGGGGVGTWSSLPQMNDRRWYPTTLTLGNGSTLVWGGTTISGGYNSTPQILEKQFNGNYEWRSLRIKNPEKYNLLYTWTYLLSSGRVLVVAEQYQKSFLLNLGDRFQNSRLYTYPYSPTWGEGGMTDPHDAGTSVLYDKDSILALGGADLPKATGEFINMGGATPQWKRIARMQFGRRHANATVLPDGKVLVTGGNSNTGFNGNCGEGFVYTAEMWDPASLSDPLQNDNLYPNIYWKQLADASYRRLYHSTAVLLPDGRVLSGGTTNYPKEIPLCRPHKDIYDIEVFYPPYFFKSNGDFEDRPVIATAPTTGSYGQPVQFTVTGAGSNPKVNFIRLPSVTHSFNQNQGVVKFNQPSVNGTNFSVTLPTNRNEMPPGHYMMFVINTDNNKTVPSVAKIIQVQ
ncbi:MAG: galactose oxidase-like domain-containing protein [Pyrinomonadaceae bacterium]